MKPSLVITKVSSLTLVAEGKTHPPGKLSSESSGNWNTELETGTLNWKLDINLDCVIEKKRKGFTKSFTGHTPRCVLSGKRDCLFFSNNLNWVDNSDLKLFITINQ